MTRHDRVPVSHPRTGVAHRHGANRGKREDVSDRREDELEQALLEVQALIESSVAIHRDRSVQEQLITAVDSSYGAVLDTARNLINGAARSIEIVHARRPSVSDQSARQSDRVERELLYGAAEGVCVRLLTVPPLLDEEFVREQFGRERPVAVRVARIPRCRRSSSTARPPSWWRSPRSGAGPP